MKILYFAWMREHIGTSIETIERPDHVTNVGELVEHLRSQSEGHALALSDMEVVRVAVNQTHSDLSAAVADGDEVAFFPPITGG